MINLGIGTELLTVAFNTFKRENETARQKFYLDMSAFYFRVKDQMEDVIKEKFERKPFSKKTLQNMFYFHDDVIDKIISRKTAGTFTKQPVITVGEKIDSDLDDFLYSINFWENIKEVYKRSKYFNTVILHPVYDADEKNVRLDILHGENCSVISKKDYLKMKEIKIQRVDEKQEIYYAYWSDEEHYIIDGSGNKISVDGNENGVNPYWAKYKDKPFAIYRDKIGWDFWGDPNIALYTFQMLHTLKVSDNERGEFYYKFPIGIGRNLKITNDEELSPGKILNHEAMNSETIVNLQYINTGTDWSAIRENEKERRESFLINQKLPASSASIDVNALSGAAKNIDELELVESRDEDKTNLLRFIYDAVKKTMMVANYNKVYTKEYKEDKVSIQLQDVEHYETEGDKWLRREKELALGMKDIIDFIIEDEECSEEEAIKILESKRARREKIKLEDKTAKPTTLNDLFPQPEPTNGKEITLNI